MSVHTNLSAAVHEAERDAESKQEPMAVVEWWQGSRRYLVRTLAKATSLCAKHDDAKVRVTVYPKGGTLDGVG
jgi:hypothetical protein